MFLKFLNWIEEYEKSKYIKIWIFILPLFIYASTIIFPYLLADDLWLIRDRQNAPSLMFISIAQGRPFFSFIVLLMRFITEYTHLFFVVISFLRISAILCISIFAIIIFGWLKKWGWSSFKAMICIAFFISLPSIQLYVANGQWVAMGMLSAGLSIYFLDKYFLAQSRRQKQWFLIGILLSLLFSWGTYQITPFFMVALLIVPILTLTKENIWPIKAFRFLPLSLQNVLLGMCCFFASLILYISCWFFLKHCFPEFESGDKRYGITFSNFKNYFIPILCYFFTTRLSQILNLWWVDSFAMHFSGVLVLSISLSGLFFEAIKKNRIKGVFWSVLQGVLICIFLLFLDLPALSQPGPSGNFQPNYSYMTSGALCLGMIIVFFHFLSKLIPLDSNPFVKKIGYGMSVVSAFFGGCMVYSHFSFPQWHDRLVLETELIKKLTSNQKITHIIVYPPIHSLQRGIGEYSWCNYDAEFYAKLLVHSILDNKDLDARKDILIAINTIPKSKMSKTSSKTAVIDLRQQ